MSEEPEKSAVDSLKDGAKNIAGDALGGAARGAIQGAAGGVPGIAVGAAKGAAISLAKNRNVQKIAVGTLIGIVLVVVLVVISFMQTISAVAGVISDMEDENSQATAEEEADTGEADDGGSSDLTQIEIDDAQVAARVSGVSWQIVLAATQVDEDFDVNELLYALTDADPRVENRALTAGYTQSTNTTAMEAPEDDDEDQANIRAAAVRDTYITALSSEDVGFSASQAKDIYERALGWATSNGAAQVCSATPSGGGTTPGGESTGLDGENWNDNQVANMKIIIGVAKTMFGDNAEDAAIIGLITAAVESRFQNYANDGIIGPEDGGAVSAQDGQNLKHSLTLDHDAVGTDHGSVGIMQQQVYSWGDYGTSTWSTEPNKVIERLMDPTFAAAKFFTSMNRIDWKSKTPGEAAQAVQISAFPDRYQERVTLAQEIWDKYAADQDPLDVPVETGWDGAVGESSATPGSSSSCTGGSGGSNNGGKEVDTDVTWPIDQDADGMFVGVITSDYGPRIHPSGRQQFHAGLDMGGNGYGSPIYAAAGGTVVRSDLWSPACGEYVEILHEDQSRTGYLHMTARDVKVGDVVKPGDKVGDMGGGQPGGCTFGPHLHMYAFPAPGYTGETYSEYGNTYMDPKEWFKQRGLEVPASKMP